MTVIHFVSACIHLFEFHKHISEKQTFQMPDKYEYDVLQPSLCFSTVKCPINVYEVWLTF